MDERPRQEAPEPADLALSAAELEAEFRLFCDEASDWARHTAGVEVWPDYS